MRVEGSGPPGTPEDLNTRAANLPLVPLFDPDGTMRGPGGPGGELQARGYRIESVATPRELRDRLSADPHERCVVVAEFRSTRPESAHARPVSSEFLHDYELARWRRREALRRAGFTHRHANLGPVALGSTTPMVVELRASAMFWQTTSVHRAEIAAPDALLPALERASPRQPERPLVWWERLLWASLRSPVDQFFAEEGFLESVATGLDPATEPPLLDLLVDLRRGLHADEFWPRWRALPSAETLVPMEPFLKGYFRARDEAPAWRFPGPTVHSENPDFMPFAVGLKAAIEQLRARCRPAEVAPASPPAGRPTDSVPALERESPEP